MKHRPALWIGLGALYAIAALLFFADPRLALALGLAAGAVVVALESPLWGVAFLIAGRITSTGANAWVRIGHVNVDLFEPALVLVLVALAAHAATHGRRIWVAVPWRPWVLLFGLWQVLGLFWSRAPDEGAQELIATAVLLATTLVLLAFVGDESSLRRCLEVWVGTSALVGLLGMTGILAGDNAFEMASGSRAGGFGQHPNWYSMNLLFAIYPALALGWTSRSRALRWTHYSVAVLLVVAQLQSGSRGGLVAVVLGGLVAAFGARGFRKAVALFALVAAVIVGVVVFSDLGAASRAYERAFTVGTVLAGRSVRVANWTVCWQLLLDTRGVGIGGGGYSTMLTAYDAWLSESQYRYPHGVVWGVMAHQGVVGLALMAGFVVSVARMGLRLVRSSAGTPSSALAWAMVATLAGYFAWTFVEFSYDDKPFWEFLGLFSALWLQVGSGRLSSEARPPPTVREP